MRFSFFFALILFTILFSCRKPHKDDIDVQFQNTTLQDLAIRLTNNEWRIVSKGDKLILGVSEIEKSTDTQLQVISRLDQSFTWDQNSTFTPPTNTIQRLNINTLKPDRDNRKYEIDVIAYDNPAIDSTGFQIFNVLYTVLYAD